jgi:flagellar protein FliO/FliZ
MRVLLDLVSVGFALAIVLALAFFAISLLKKLQVGSGTADDIRHLRSLPVGQRERLTLVSYRGEVLLLGVTAGGIDVLDRRTRTAEEIAAEVQAAEARAAALANARQRAAQPWRRLRGSLPFAGRRR